MTGLIEKIESGKQRGHSKKTEIEGIIYWCDAAIQKYYGNYRVHVSLIKERNMDQEKYDIYFTREFSTIGEAFLCVKENGQINLEEFSALKGQKIFNASLIEENDI
ncbi:MAG: hypothetical protein GQ574_08845 [Crocinitomix sp.]|nr:hypothetical protein [Crocinitomix sp.]